MSTTFVHQNSAVGIKATAILTAISDAFPIQRSFSNTKFFFIYDDQIEERQRPIRLGFGVAALTARLFYDLNAK
jgi:hypothetical protein